MRNSTALCVTGAILLAASAGTAWAQNASPNQKRTSITIPSSSNSNTADAGLRAHTNIQTLTTFTGAPQAAGPPFPGLFYEDPASINCIYFIQLQPQVTGCNPNTVSLNPSGGSRAIAIVDAYDDPNAFSDLQTFSTQFGVQPISASTFIVAFAPNGGVAPGSCIGTATKPPVDPTGGWEVEEALDIEWAHAMAPGAKLYLVEAQSNNDNDLLCAVTVAGNLVKAAGGGEVSMSWGGPEFPLEALIDPVFTTPGVVYFASAGDSPGPSWPSVSPNVVSVGGTSISRNAATGAYLQENDWQDGGSGISLYESRPAYQNGISNIVGNHRGTPDVSSDANPYTGVWVLDNFLPPAGCGPQCWYIVGGTSVSSPTWAGIVNAAGSFASSSSAELATLYHDSQAGDFTDITVGSCGPYMGFLATTGWDVCTGLGSPKYYTGK